MIYKHKWNLFVGKLREIAIWMENMVEQTSHLTYVAGNESVVCLKQTTWLDEQWQETDKLGKKFMPQLTHTHNSINGLLLFPIFNNEMHIAGPYPIQTDQIQ